MRLTSIIAILAGVIYPVFVLLTYRKFNREMRRDARYKLADYKRTIVIFWLLTGLILTDQFLGSEAALDFYPDFKLAGIITGVLILAVLGLQFMQLNIRPENADTLRKQLGDN